MGGFCCFFVLGMFTNILFCLNHVNKGQSVDGRDYYFISLDFSVGFLILQLSDKVNAQVIVENRRHTTLIRR